MYISGCKRTAVSVILNGQFYGHRVTYFSLTEFYIAN